MKVYEIPGLISFPVARGNKLVDMWLGISVKRDNILNDNYKELSEL